MENEHIHSKSAVDQFRDAITAKGITPPEEIIADGKIHRFSSSGKTGNDAGWYVFYNGEIAAGAFGDFRTSQKIPSWKADIGRPLTADEKLNFQKKQDEIRAAIAADKEQLRIEAKIKASLVMAATKPADDNHPYLIKKDVKANGIVQWKDPVVTVGHNKRTGKPYLLVTSKDRNAQIVFGIDLEAKPVEEICQNWKDILVIPMQDATGEIQSLQFISTKGDKKFLYGGKMQGSYFTLGDINGSETILIAEGYATAATIHEATGYPVVVAYNAGNLTPVARSIRAQWPDTTIVLCADDDIATTGNPGIAKATEAAEAIGGQVLVPDFGQNRPEGVTDFNDMATHLGKAAVTRFFDNQSFERRNKMNTRNPHTVVISKPANLNTAPAPDQGLNNATNTQETSEQVRSNEQTQPKPINVQPIRPQPEPVAEPKAHFSPEEFKIIQKIWTNVPRKASYHSESGYHLVVDEKRKIIITRDRIELANKAKHRPDEAYAAACEHARQFWQGQMEVHGDTQHRIKAWAYAGAYGIKITNFTPTDSELIQANIIMDKLRKTMEPTNGRPLFSNPQTGTWPNARP